MAILKTQLEKVERAIGKLGSGGVREFVDSWNAQIKPEDADAVWDTLLRVERASVLSGQPVPPDPSDWQGYIDEFDEELSPDGESWECYIEQMGGME